MSKMRNIATSLLLITAMVASIFASAVVLIRPVYAVNASDFYSPANTVGNLNPAPGTIAPPWKANVSNVPSPGLWGYELYTALSKKAFPEQAPVTNMNFTGSITGWTITTTTFSGTPTSGYDSSTGNPSPGSGVGSLRVRANSTASVAADILFDVDSPSFTWNLGAPPDGGVLVSFAYRFTGNSLSTPAARFTPLLVRPDASIKILYGSSFIDFSTTKPWTYNTSVVAVAGNFNKADGTPLTGSYKLRMEIELGTLAVGASNYVQWNWDDVGILIAPVRVEEGSFLKSQPPVLPLSNMNFTSNAASWTTGTAPGGSGTSAFSWIGTDGNPSPGSGAGSLMNRANSTAGATANLQIVSNQSFSWSSGTPLNAFYSYAYKVTGNSFFPTQLQQSPSAASGTWSNGANAFASDNTYASTSTNAANETYGTYQLGNNIPAGVTITKVEVGLEAFTTNTAWNLNITVSWDGGTTWSPFIINGLPTSDPNRVSWNDFTFATTWTIAKLTNANFQVRIRAWQTTGSAGTIDVDWLPVRVTWSAGYVNLQLVRPDNSVISLQTVPFNASTSGWVYLRGNIISTSVFSASGTYVFQIVANLRTNAVGITNYVQVTWDDVGLILYIAGGGPTFFTTKYLRYATNNTIYVADTITGNPYINGIPVIGAGNLFVVKILVGYGWSWLHLYKTTLLTLDAGNNPTPLAHTDTDGWFDNRIPGDANADGTVGTLDLGAVNGHWSPTGGPFPGSLGYSKDIDVNNDGIIQTLDLGVINSHWGQHYP